MAEGQDQDDKTEEPTPKRLEDARKRGDIIYSTEAATFTALLAATGLLAMGSDGFAAIGRWLMGYFEHAHRLPADGGGLQRLALDGVLRFSAAIGVLGLVLGGAGLAARYVQDKPTFTASKLQPKLENIDPTKGFKRIFGAQAFANFLKGLVKLVLVGAAAAWAMWPRDATLETLPLLDIHAFWPLAKQRSLDLLWICLWAFLVLAGADYLYTRHSYLKRLRMSRRDIRDELRQSEGDPQTRARLRRIRLERSRRRMMQNVPKATVVVTNPTHYAVALRYVSGETAAPVCLAKGVDDVALKIRALAEEHAIPVVEDPPLARALHASAEIDEIVPREHFEAVAKVISFVIQLEQRRRGRANRP